MLYTCCGGYVRDCENCSYIGAGTGFELRHALQGAPEQPHRHLLHDAGLLPWRPAADLSLTLYAVVTRRA